MGLERYMCECAIRGCDRTFSDETWDAAKAAASLIEDRKYRIVTPGHETGSTVLACSDKFSIVMEMPLGDAVAWS